MGNPNVTHILISVDNGSIIIMKYNPVILQHIMYTLVHTYVRIYSCDDTCSYSTYHGVQLCVCLYMQYWCLCVGDELILLLFSPVFLSGNSFIFSLLCSIFCSKFVN